MIAGARCWFTIALLGWLIPNDLPGADHPFHSTHAVVEFNSDTRSFEVSLCVFPDDLAEALSKRANRSVALESEPDLDTLLAAWVAEEFQIRLGDDPPQTMTWLGHEFETQQTWLYFEFPVDERALADVKVRSTVFMDQFDDQINVVYARFGGRQRCISYRTDTPSWQTWNLSRKPSAEISSAPLEAQAASTQSDGQAER